MSEEELLTSAEMAEKLKISRPTFDKLVAEGMPYCKVGENKRFIATDVLEWLKERQNA